MSSPVLSCGILVFSDDDELLLCHATGTVAALEGQAPPPPGTAPAGGGQAPSDNQVQQTQLSALGSSNAERGYPASIGSLAYRRGAAAVSGPRAGCDYRRKWRFLTSFVAQRLFQQPCDLELGLARDDLRQRPRQRVGGDARGLRNQCDFVLILGFAKRFNQSGLRSPLPASAIVEQTLEVPMVEVL